MARLTELQKKHNRIQRSTLTQLNKILKNVRDKYGVKLGLSLGYNNATIYTYKGNERVFGAYVAINVDFDSTKTDTLIIEMNHGSVGSFDPAGDNNGATLAYLISETMRKWGRIEPVFQEAFKVEDDIREAYVQKEMEKHKKYMEDRKD